MQLRGPWGVELPARRVESKAYSLPCRQSEEKGTSSGRKIEEDLLTRQKYLEPGSKTKHGGPRGEDRSQMKVAENSY